MSLATPWTVQSMEFSRILEWAAIPFSRGSFQPRDRTQVSHIAGGFFTSWATREVHISIGMCVCVCVYIYTHTYIIYTHTHNLSFFKHLRKSSRLWSFIPKYLSIYFLRIGHNYTIVIKVRKLMLILTAELKDIELIWSANKCKTDEVKHWE